MHLIRFFQKESVRQFVKFGVVGVLNTAVDLGVFYLLTQYTPIYYLFASIISFSLGIINSYIWNRIWTFRSLNKEIGKEFSKFVIVSVIGLALNTLFLSVLVELFSLPQFIGKIAATVLVVVWSFFMSKYWAFKSAKDSQ